MHTAMFCLTDTMRYFLCTGSVDMRKGINSLCGLVHDRMGYDVRNGDVFIFVGGRRKDNEAAPCRGWWEGDVCERNTSVGWVPGKRN